MLYFSCQEWKFSESSYSCNQTLQMEQKQSINQIVMFTTIWDSSFLPLYKMLHLWVI